MYGDICYTIFCRLKVPEDSVECTFFTIIHIDSILVYENKYFLKVCLANCAYKIVNTEMADYLHVNLFETDWFLSFINTEL